MQPQYETNDPKGWNGDPARGAVTLHNPTGRRVLGVKVEK